MSDLFRAHPTQKHRLVVEVQGPGDMEQAIEALFALGFVKERTAEFGTGFLIQSVERERVEVPSGDD